MRLARPQHQRPDNPTPLISYAYCTPCTLQLVLSSRDSESLHFPESLLAVTVRTELVSTHARSAHPVEGEARTRKVVQ